MFRGLEFFILVSNICFIIAQSTENTISSNRCIKHQITTRINRHSTTLHLALDIYGRLARSYLAIDNEKKATLPNGAACFGNTEQFFQFGNFIKFSDFKEIKPQGNEEYFFNFFLLISENEKICIAASKAITFQKCINKLKDLRSKLESKYTFAEPQFTHSLNYSNSLTPFFRGFNVYVLAKSSSSYYFKDLDSAETICTTNHFIESLNNNLDIFYTDFYQSIVEIDGIFGNVRNGLQEEELFHADFNVVNLWSSSKFHSTKLWTAMALLFGHKVTTFPKLVYKPKSTQTFPPYFYAYLKFLFNSPTPTPAKRSVIDWVFGSNTNKINEIVNSNNIIANDLNKIHKTLHNEHGNILSIGGSLKSIALSESKLQDSFKTAGEMLTNIQVELILLTLNTYIQERHETTIRHYSSIILDKHVTFFEKLNRDVEKYLNIQDNSCFLLGGGHFCLKSIPEYTFDSDVQITATVSKSSLEDFFILQCLPFNNAIFNFTGSLLIKEGNQYQSKEASFADTCLEDTRTCRAFYTTPPPPTHLEYCNIITLQTHFIINCRVDLVLSNTFHSFHVADTPVRIALSELPLKTNTNLTLTINDIETTKQDNVAEYLEINIRDNFRPITGPVLQTQQPLHHPRIPTIADEIADSFDPATVTLSSYLVPASIVGPLLLISLIACIFCYPQKILNIFRLISIPFSACGGCCKNINTGLTNARDVLNTNILRRQQHQTGEIEEGRPLHILNTRPQADNTLTQDTTRDAGHSTVHESRGPNVPPTDPQLPPYNTYLDQKLF